MKLSTALLAALGRRELNAVIDTGLISKSDQRVIAALRAGDQSGETAKHRVFSAIRKQFAERAALEDRVRKGIEAYARQRVAQMSEETTMTTAADLLNERVDKARTDVQMLRDTVRKYEAAHPGVTRSNALDAVLYGPHTAAIVDLERRLDNAVAKLGGGNLPTPRPGTMQTRHNDAAPILGRTGYDASVDDTHPRTAHASGGPQSGPEPQPTIEDSNDVLERLTKAGMRAGKSRAKAMSDAAMSQEFSDAHRRERARKYGI